MARARFLCVAARGLTPGGGPGIAPGEAPFFWRLVGANNRELGRMAVGGGGPSGCCEALDVLRAGLDRAVTRVKPAASADAWGWVLEIDGIPTAVSGRSYMRQRECQYSLAQFLAAAPGAGGSCGRRVAVGTVL